MAVRSEKLTFTGSSGEQLAARLDAPEGEVQGYALFAHCFTCTKDIFAAARIAAGLAERGIAVLRFDFTGLGHSEGEFANTNFSSNVADLVRAADFLRQTRAAPKLLIGHSLGGAAVLAAAGQVPEALAVATIGAPAEPAHVQHLFQAAKPEIEARGEAEVLLAGRPFCVKKQFLEDIEAKKLADDVATLKKALLVFHAPRDETVSIDNAGAIFGAAKHPKSFVSLDAADHLLTRKEDARYVARVLAAWATRYVGEAPSEATAAAPAAGAPGEVVVAESGLGRLQQTIVAGTHHLTADEPASVGGTDRGPTPYDLLLAGLGACTSMTLRLYADRKKWPLEKTTVHLSHDRIHAEDCADCESTEGRVDRMFRKLTLDGPLDGAQKAKLLEIADKCPVHRTLENEIKVVTELAG
ncbi:MAG: bifunctional alpha/beta hydrolase/OsmC family protein [Pseudomonadota bacterium]